MAQFFNNRTIVAPSTEVAIDDTQIGPSATSSQQVNVGIVGLSTKGQPSLPILVSSVDEAVRAFGQGNLVDGIRRAFAPAAGGGAEQVYGVRVNPATQGTVTLLDTNSDTSVALTSKDYGIYTRGLSVAVAAATNAGTGNVPTGALKVTVSSPTLPEAVDNLGYNVLQFESLNSGGTVQVNISTGTIGTGYSAGQVTSIAVNSGGSGYSGSTTTVILSAPQTAGGVTATAHGVVSGGVVTSVVVDTAGSGYTSAPTVTFPDANTTLATATASVGAVKTNPSVSVTASNQTAHQYVGQQVTIANSGGTQPFSTMVTAESGGVLTISPGDPFTRTTSATVKGSGPALLLYTTTAGDQAGLPLANYGTLDALRLAATSVSSNWSFRVPSQMNPTPGAVSTIGSTSSPSILDVGQSVTVVQTTDPVGAPHWGNITGIAQAVTDWLNGTGENYFTAVRGAKGLVPVVTAAKFATGGADDGSGGSLLSGVALTLTNTDWNNALNALATVDTPVFTLMSGDPNIIALGDAHAVTMSSTGRLERIQIAGLVLGKSTTDALTAAAGVNNYRTCLVYPGIRDFDSNGNLISLDPFYAAAQVAGLASGLPENEALTGKALRIQGLEIRSQSNGGPFGPSDVDACLQGGVMPIAFRPGKGFIIVQSITTWLQDVKYVKRELSVRRIVDRLARSVRERLDERIGDGVTPGFLNIVLTDTKDVLETYAQRDFIVGDDAHPPYQGITVSLQQGHPDTVLVSFEASPAIPANYILVTVHLRAFGS